MSEVYENLHVGGMDLCSWTPAKAVAHLCKHPCHVNAVGYKGSLAPSHPEYLMAKRGRQIFGNLVDAPVPIFRKEIFDAVLDFIDEALPKGPVWCHCNNGVSRAPSIALLWLARRAKAIPAETFDQARASFVLLYPSYEPGKGIETFLRHEWEVLR